MQPIFKPNRLSPLLGLVVLGLAGCTSLPEMLQPAASGAPPEAQAETAPASPEDQLLASLGAAGAGVEVALADGLRGVAGESYTAASGRTCRLARLHYPDGRSAQRLACEVEGRWQWVPAVTMQLNG